MSCKRQPPLWIKTSSYDDDFYNNPHAIMVTGYYGDPVIDQFDGSGPSPTLFSFKALLVADVIYQPDPRQDRYDLAQREDRLWIPCRVQPTPSHLKPAKRWPIQSTSAKLE